MRFIYIFTRFLIVNISFVFLILLTLCFKSYDFILQRPHQEQHTQTDLCHYYIIQALIWPHDSSVEFVCCAAL